MTPKKHPVRPTTSMAVAISVLYSLAAWPQPEFLIGAMKYGAKDCTFCHATATGGQGLNERGTWLVDQKIERAEEIVSVEWLKERDEVVVEAPQADSFESLVVPTPDSVTTQQTDQETESADERTFDYTTSHGEWPAYSGDPQARKYSPVDQIRLANVENLSVAWVWESELDRGVDGKAFPDPFKGTPLMVDGRVFVRTRFSAVEAIDAFSGRTLWKFDPEMPRSPRPPMFGFSTRGLGYYEDDTGQRVILLTTDGWLYSLDATSGKPIEDFGDGGRVDMKTGLRRPLTREMSTWSYAPTVCNDTIVVGSQTNDGSEWANFGSDWKENLPVGDVRGFDVHTGEQKWVFETIPQGDAFGTETWGNESWRYMGNTNVWSMTSCDPDLGHAYLPTSAPSQHMFGGFRHGDNLFSTSIVAVDIENGERVWHFQTVHHDIWDYDNPAAPVVTDTLFEGKPTKAVAAVTKTGYLYVFNRVTGVPLWPIEEVEVPGSTIDEERPSPTQPIPTWPPPFEPNGITEDNLISLSPELNRRARELLKSRRWGEAFLPPSLEGSMINPGVGGGANWGGAAYDPESRHLFVGHRRMPMWVQLSKLPGIRFPFIYRGDFGVVDIEGLPLVNPPWSSITAYNMDTGEVTWTVANGEGPKRHPLLRGLDLPDLGNVGNAPGLLVTPELIFLGESGRPNRLKALDKRSGQAVWRGNLTGVWNEAPPITYRYRGKQFVVIGTGMALEPARLIAFALP